MPPRNFAYYGAGKVRIVTDGLAEVTATLAALPNAFRVQAAITIGEAAEIIEQEAKARVPVLTGTLQASIGANIREDGLSAAVGSGARYAPVVEFGSKTQPAQPWLYPAFRVGARHVRNRMKDWTDGAGTMAKVRAKRSKNVREVAKLSKRGQKYAGRPRAPRKGRAERAGR